MSNMVKISQITVFFRHYFTKQTKKFLEDNRYYDRYYWLEPLQSNIYKNYRNFNAQDFLNYLETKSRLEKQAAATVSYVK